MRRLDVTSESTKAEKVRRSLRDQIIGQADAINALVDISEKFHAKLFDKSKPIASALFLGPTGCGKTRIVEGLCEAFHGDRKHMLKIDCGEFQHSHDIAKLVGSPPGYLGHRETPPLLTQERINDLKSKEYDLSIILFDEIEKASDALWHILLGILDKGRLTLGTNAETSFIRTIILMTSNAGSGEMEFALNGGFGFRRAENVPVNDAEIAEIGVAAAKRKFTTEFINRLDRIIACHALTKEQCAEVVSLELKRLQFTIFTECSPPIHFHVSDQARAALLEEGYDPKYNARNIKRAIEQRIQFPLAKIIASKQLCTNERVYVTFSDGEFHFDAE